MPIFLNWKSINEGYFNFTKSLQRQDETRDNPFATTVQVSSNLNDALGTIGLSARNTVEFTP